MAKRVIIHGFEFENRNSGAYPWQYRPVGGCRHDWIKIGYDNPIIKFLEAEREKILKGK